LDDTSSANVSFSPERTRGFQVLWSRWEFLEHVL
jgi:hypothetical protein